MRWKKLGKIYSLPRGGLHKSIKTHTANPLAVHLSGDEFRVFYSARDDDARSSVCAVDIDIIQKVVTKEHIKPLLKFGGEDSFYSEGISIGNLYEAKGSKFILFMGWKNQVDKHWYGEIGRIKVNKDLSLSLEDKDKKPFIPLDTIDAISLSYPWVHKNSESSFDMWYGSTISWAASSNSEMIHIIKHAHSEDGVHWRKTESCIPYVENIAQAFSRPTVAECEGGLRMWFSYRSGRGETYRIGSAVSQNKKNWQLDLDNQTLDISEDGWDSEMVEYPFVFDHKGDRYMLYNGNGYGKSGFGLAVLKHDE